ncbi:hypothetical protein GYMLUDRAFT_243779 [Collybiopsis luxurians FD-317 M1]|uniref:Unplaced genomic scaffold GYMLUscaffold_24, whole genome shotgun sequence n=1 Tax=Collybiopsis luxurians FD-317 M1 TaxID=944289 RepID=A0A0D0CQ37_9AGAR|nr:hypothetical protein GYMLUDRAFT_243779 [Collybiopsis luxurians FD-317 M1]
MPCEERKLRVAIVGGGIGGLTCAAALKDCSSIQVDLFEAATRFVAIGAGIVTWPRTWSVFRALGLKEEMLEALKEKEKCNHEQETRPAWQFRMSDRKEGVPFHEVHIEGAKATNLHRQQLLDLLLDNLPSHCRVHFGHRLVACEEDEKGVELRFLNGIVASFDLVIAADGLKSVVRQTVAGIKPLLDVTAEENFIREDILHTGQSAFRGLIPREQLIAVNPNHRALHTPTIYCGKDKHVVAYPISSGEIINVVAFYSDSRSGSPVMCSTGSSSPQIHVDDVPLSTILDTYPGWEDEAVQLLKMMKDPTIWPILDLKPLESYVTSRIALLGDAAHSMGPHLGAGANTAMEDAYILGTLISKYVHTSKDVCRVLKIYDTLRRPYGNEIMRWARETGDYYEFESEYLQNKQETIQDYYEPTKEQLSNFGEGVDKYWTWPIRTAGTIEEDMKRAELMLGEQKICRVC